MTLHKTNFTTFCRPIYLGGAGVQHTTQICQTVLFQAQNGQKWDFCRRVTGARFKTSTFRAHIVHILGVSHLPKIDPGYGADYFCNYMYFVCQFHSTTHQKNFKIVLYVISHLKSHLINKSHSCFLLMIGKQRSNQISKQTSNFV